MSDDWKDKYEAQREAAKTAIDAGERLIDMLRKERDSLTKQLEEAAKRLELQGYTIAEYQGDNTALSAQLEIAHKAFSEILNRSSSINAIAIAQAALAALKKGDLGLNRIDKLEKQLDEARKALRDIAVMHINYDHPANGKGEYGIGVTDGHRCAANAAKDALASLEGR